MTIVVLNDTIEKFRSLFAGFPSAFGTGRGGWVHREPTDKDFREHLTGLGDGLGIGPLRSDGTVSFAAIDLDEPRFDLAADFASVLPGASFTEQSRSGNAHVLIFFEEPIEAWVVRGILREACAAFGRKNVEVFPKSDRLLPGMVGNYLNLPYFGDARPIIQTYIEGDLERYDPPLRLTEFISVAEANLNSPDAWRKRARWLGIPSPEERAATNSATFGASPTLHICGQHVIEHRDDNPVLEGHRAVVYFALSKMLCNWSEVDDDEALSMLALVNDASPDPISAQELGRIYRNAKRGEFTSTSCDDPLFLPYRHPNCKIGN